MERRSSAGLAPGLAGAAGPAGLGAVGAAGLATAGPVGPAGFGTPAGLDGTAATC